jgi:Rha family phage regulatory protein
MKKTEEKAPATVPVKRKEAVLVEVQNGTGSPFEGQPITTSLLVAKKFGKRHDHVLRDIKNLMSQNWGVKNLFVEATYLNERKQQQPKFIMIYKKKKLLNS